ncbi:helix-turn-helix domain-containing protein [Aeromonas enteropelogenes]|uniref:helix-turn-helix domain-containing protein n=1 Tax=Aeromonas enteropelogenes TaxID=29489 RepID=UPI003BA1FE39
MQQRETPQDWTPEQVMKACKAAGMTLRQLSISYTDGKSATVLYRALRDASCARYEEVIAELLGLRVEDIWPERCAIRAAIAEKRAQAMQRVQTITARQVA